MFAGKDLFTSLIIVLILFVSLGSVLYATEIYLIDETGSSEIYIIADGSNLPDFIDDMGFIEPDGRKKNYEVQRFREVTVSHLLKEHGKVAEGDAVIFNLFEDLQFKGVIDRVSQNINGTFSVRARIEGYPFGYMIISTTEARSLATIRIPEEGEFLLIKSDPHSFRHYLLDIGEENRHYLESGPPLVPPDSDDRERRIDRQERSHQQEEQHRNPGPDDPAIIDVMIIYTEQAADWATFNGGGIDNVIAQTVELSQLAYDNSNTIMTLNLVHSSEVEYEGSGSGITDLMRMTFREDWDPWGYEGGPPWYMEEIHDWRDECGADMVAMLSLVNDVGGVAWQLNNINGRPEMAFSLTRVQQAATTYTFVHELGHNMGAHHHRAQNFQPGPGLFNYSAGWRWTTEDNQRFCTVMTYTSGQYFEDGLNHVRVGYFSNPNIEYEDYPTGHAVLGDNARTLRLTKHVIAAYRERVFVVDDYPWQEIFDEEDFPPPGWHTGSIAGDSEWERSSGGNENNPQGAAEGESNALFYAGAERGHSGYLISPEFHFSGKVNRQLAFAHAQAARGGDQDVLNVYYSRSKTAGWRSLVQYDGNVPDWTNRTIQLPDSLDMVFIKFEAIGNNGYGVVLDDINVTCDPATDYPLAAINPYPISDSVSVSLDLADLSWDYLADTTYVEPAGFKVYMNNTGEFGEDDDFEWVAYDVVQTRYSNGDILQDLQFGRKYYWQVVPATAQEGGNEAVNPSVWAFWTEGPLVQVMGRIIGNDAPDGLAGATVFLSNVNDTFRVETGADGSFAINDVEGNFDGLPYRLVVSREGYETYTGIPTVIAEPLNLGNIRLDEGAYQPRNLAANIGLNFEYVNLSWDIPQPPERRNIRRESRMASRSHKDNLLRVLEGYEVYLFEGYDEEEFAEWIFLSEIDNTMYRDSLWVNYQPGRYKYAVRAVYTDEVYSDFVYSDLLSKEFQSGIGTEDNPWLISSAEELNRVRHYLGVEHADKHFKQIADIDFSETEWNEGQGWLPIGSSSVQFRGYYDGNGYTIENLMIDRTEMNNVGLFGFCRNATFKNISLLNADIRGGRWVGGIVGDLTGTDENPGRVINCYTGGNITGLDRVGGLVGYLLRSNIDESYSSADINGLDTGQIGAGGLVGFVTIGSSIRDSFATGSIRSENDGSHLGGLAGRAANASIINCYAVGSVEEQTASGGLIGSSENVEITNSYYNIQTTGQDESAGGEGKTTAEMTYPYDEDTYSDWDFEQVWMADVAANINSGYPFLTSFFSDSPLTASNPLPVDKSTGVSINLDELRWSYMPEPTYTNPAGFRIYLNNTGQFDENDDFEWIPYIENVNDYSCFAILPDRLQNYNDYYWMVVPTTNQPERRDNSRGRRAEIAARRAGNVERGDAVDVAVWSFRTEQYPTPVTAINPFPLDESIDVPVTLDSLRWNYLPDPAHINPVGFRVYLGNTDEFDDESEFVWVPFIEDKDEYATGENFLQEIEPLTTYYWMVVPTTKELEQRRAKRAKYENNRGEKRIASNRTDAHDVPVWSFTTIDPTNVETIHELPLLTKLIGNYPNPFNPDTVIEFSIKEEITLELKIYNVKGQMIKSLYRGLLPAGKHQIIWNGKDESGQEVGSGVYFYRMTTEEYDRVRKMILIK